MLVCCTQADIINRGMSGYNSRWALQVRCKALAQTRQQPTQQQYTRNSASSSGKRSDGTGVTPLSHMPRDGLTVCRCCRKPWPTWAAAGLKGRPFGVACWAGGQQQHRGVTAMWHC